MTRAALFFAALVAVAVLMLLSALDFGKLPLATDRSPVCGAPVAETPHG